MNDESIRDAYIYLLGRMLVIRQEMTDRAGDGFAYNTVRYNPLGSADFVNPNFDVAYLEAWIAVDDDTAVLLEVPEITGRYYTAQVLDEWGEVIVNINERATPVKPSGTFAFTKPGSTVSIPPGASRIDLHSGKAKLLGRIELGDDPDIAVALQKRFTLTPLGDITVPAPPPVPGFDNTALLGVEIFDLARTVVPSALDVSPAAAGMQLQAGAVADHVAGSAANRAEVDRLLTEIVIPEFRDYAYTKSARVVNNWIVGDTGGHYGADYTKRTVANLIGLWANSPSEVIYFSGSLDADGKPLDGAGSYVLNFPADALPASAVDGYWSVILVSVPDFRVVPNHLNRYNFNSHSDLAVETDGSLRIGLGANVPAGVAESNWLPCQPGERFSLTFRAYVPKDIVRTGQWAPPPIVRSP
ncbi:DUF1214 domain-containing protein [Mycolicibacterium brisbanense]|uniref:DUF1254 domain-containing protein n=1 Tax=Mycolicibacterium brisbanense TaxID=146020 RepID=A0A100W2K7_9MYCO|nr:DUF1214 domain-containing protein [Mycolicibacterium brisbanense]MCV7158490.1 DUF1254 domain-containing protein [Mycolicibacterium brisbanense]GAS90458.1 uncharacterized protein RMCB_4554 [Mycolicibacterium brisbanense]